MPDHVSFSLLPSVKLLLADHGRKRVAGVACAAAQRHPRLLFRGCSLRIQSLGRAFAGGGGIIGVSCLHKEQSSLAGKQRQLEAVRRSRGHEGVEELRFASSDESLIFGVMLDWTQCEAVERIAGKVSGAWLFKNSRVPVQALFENLKSGATLEDFLAWFPGVAREQAQAVLAYAERSLAVC